jgi:hypothetical protein
MPGYQFPPDAKFVVLDILDGQEKGEDPTHGSGQAMVSALKDELMKHGYTVSTVQSKDLADGYQEAERLGFTHVVKGVFTHWEDNATAWSMNPDRATFSLEIFEVKDRRLVGSASHQEQASGATLLSSSPTRFVPVLASKTLSRLLGWPDQGKSTDPRTRADRGPQFRWNA